MSTGDNLLKCALQPTLARIQRLAEGVSETLRPFLLELAGHICSSRVSMTKIRRKVGASEYIVRLFRRELGLGPMEFLRECRLEISMWLLRESSLTVAEVAAFTGYGTQRALEKIYEQSCGLSPAQASKLFSQVPAELRLVTDELFSWYFWVKHHRGELGTPELLDAQAYLEGNTSSLLDKLRKSPVQF